MSSETTTEPGILEFSGKWRFLSNFYASPVRYEGIEYTTVEHAFQAAKTLDHAQRRTVAAEATPGRAKRAGKRVPLREDWETVKFGVMRILVTLKFTTNPELAKKLLETGDRHLEEGNTWGDTIWGVCRGEGQNNLGKILMAVRSEIRDLERIYQ